MTAENQWLNVHDIAEMLQVKDETVRRWIRRRELPFLELGGPRVGYRIRRDDLDHFIWQRYRMRNQNDSDREVHTELAGSTDGAGASSAVRVESVEDERGDVSQRLSVESHRPDAPPSAQAAAVQPDDRYVSLMRRIPGMTYVSTVNQETGEGLLRRMAFISDEFERLLGGVSTQLRESDRAWWEHVHPEDRERVQIARQHSCDTGERLSIEYRILPSNGHQIWVRDEAVLGDDSGDGQMVWQGIISNVSDRKRVENALRARVRQQEVVAELGDHALRQVDLRTLLKKAVQFVSQTLDAELAAVFELQPGGETLLLRAGVGWRSGLVGRATVSAGADSPAGYTLLSNEPVIVTDLLEESRFSPPPLMRDHGIRSGVSAIIAGYGKPFGVLGAHTKTARQFTTDDVNFLQSVANVLASAVMAAANHPSDSKWISIRNVAGTLRVKEETVRRWIRRGELPIIDLGSSRAGYRIHPADLEQFISERYMKP